MFPRVTRCNCERLSRLSWNAIRLLTPFCSGSSPAPARPLRIPSFWAHFRRRPGARQLPSLRCIATHRRREEDGRRQRENEASLMADIYDLLRPGRHGFAPEEPTPFRVGALQRHRHLLASQGSRLRGFQHTRLALDSRISYGGSTRTSRGLRRRHLATSSVLTIPARLSRRELREA
jgi:hypothetical protein